MLQARMPGAFLIIRSFVMFGGICSNMVVQFRNNSCEFRETKMKNTNILLGEVEHEAAANILGEGSKEMKVVRKHTTLFKGMES